MIKTIFIELFQNYAYIGIILFIITFFLRIIIVSRIYNNENGTDYFPIAFQAGPFVTDNWSHSTLCFFTFWISKYNPEDKRLALLANTISVISMIIITLLIIGINITPLALR